MIVNISVSPSKTSWEKKTVVVSVAFRANGTNLQVGDVLELRRH
jgi:hypothetical protein